MPLVDSLAANLGIPEQFAPFVSAAMTLIVILLLALLADIVARRVIVRVLHGMFRRSRSKLDDRIADRGVLLRLSRVAPAIVLVATADLIVPGVPWVGIMVRRGATAWIILVAVLVADALIDLFHDIYRTSELSSRRPIKGFVQLGKVILVLVAGILIVTTLLDRNPLGVLGGLGAMSAVLLLVFRDSILGFVSGIQLSANNMVQIGDWIEMPRYDADGDVVDVTLQSIKVQNWDKTITTIPIYALVSDSFRNWRGMSESGGRRIKRSVAIDMQSVHFVDAALLERLRRYRRIRPYLDERIEQISRHNSEHQIDLSDTVSGRRMTNLGVFRAYVKAYLREHKQIRQDMTFLVRQLPPGPAGIPIEIYVFSADQRWANYEEIQADIFDHLLAVIPEFDLRVFQEPSGADLRSIADALATGSPSAPATSGGDAHG